MMWWWLLLIPYAVLAFFAMNLWHELSHALVPWAYGWRVKITPYPRKMSDGSWLFAGYRQLSEPPGRTYSESMRGFRDLLPIVTGSIGFFSFSGLWHCWGPSGVFPVDLFIVTLISAMGFGATRGLVISFFPSRRSIDVNKAIRRLPVPRVLMHFSAVVMLVGYVLVIWFWLIPGLTRAAGG